MRGRKKKGGCVADTNGTLGVRSRYSPFFECNFLINGLKVHHQQYLNSHVYGRSIYFAFAAYCLLRSY